MKLDKTDWDFQCYGRTEASIRDQFGDSKDHAMVVASLMSDAQELIELGFGDVARQTLNVAKFVLFNYIGGDNE